MTDGIHICPEMIQLALNAQGPNGTLLITGAMRAKCLQNGHCELGGQPVIIDNGKILAGSILKMIDSVKNILTYTNLTPQDIIKLTSVKPAKQVGVYDKKGSITIGKDADI